MTNPTPAEARAALAEMKQSQAALADGLDAPFIRHLAFAAVMAILVLATTSSKMQGLTAIGMLGVVLILQWDRRRYGVFINGYRRGATLPVTIALVALLLGAMLAAIWGREHQQAWVGLVAVGVTFVAALGGSYVWQSVYRREMGA